MQDRSENNDTQVTFSDFSLDPVVIRALTANRIIHPTPIQKQVIGPILEGRDVVGKAETGTGKTIGFAAPVIGRLDVQRVSVQAMALTPTRELAQQVAGVFEDLGRDFGIRVALVVGGVHASEQIERLRTGCQVVVGTPGRVLEFLDLRILSLAWCETVVLDEADRMLDMGFIDDVTKILDRTPSERQTLLFSATLPTEIKRLLARYMKKPLICSTNEGVTTAREIDQLWVEAEFPRKFRTLCKILDQSGDETVIVFTNTKRQAIDLDRMLWGNGYSAGSLHGDQEQDVRFKILDGFRKGEIRVLVATDVASRGLDIDNIGKVINYEIPKDVESYVHRIGRTGRAKKRGEAISIVSSKERRVWQDILRRSDQPIERLVLGRARAGVDERDERPARREREQPIELAPERESPGERLPRPAREPERERAREPRRERAGRPEDREPVVTGAHLQDDPPVRARRAAAPATGHRPRGRTRGGPVFVAADDLDETIEDDVPGEPVNGDGAPHGDEGGEGGEGGEDGPAGGARRRRRRRRGGGSGGRGPGSPDWGPGDADREPEDNFVPGRLEEEAKDSSRRGGGQGSGRGGEAPRRGGPGGAGRGSGDRDRGRPANVVEFTPEELSLLQKKPRARPDKIKFESLDDGYFRDDYFEVSERPVDDRASPAEDRDTGSRGRGREREPGRDRDRGRERSGDPGSRARSPDADRSRDRDRGPAAPRSREADRAPAPERSRGRDREPERDLPAERGRGRDRDAGGDRAIDREPAPERGRGREREFERDSPAESGRGRDREIDRAAPAERGRSRDRDADDEPAADRSRGRDRGREAAPDRARDGDPAPRRPREAADRDLAVERERGHDRGRDRDSEAPRGGARGAAPSRPDAASPRRDAPRGGPASRPPADDAPIERDADAGGSDDLAAAAQRARRRRSGSRRRDA
jgi:ATP-dependent RNA helicase DeaD